MGWVVNATPQPLYPRYPLCREGWVGPRASLDGRGKSRLYLIVLALPFVLYNTNIHAPGGIRTRNPSKRSTALPLGSADSMPGPSKQ
jgi:hypothetical protein